MLEIVRTELDRLVVDEVEEDASGEWTDSNSEALEEFLD
jgi:hypothetical protein